MRMRTPVTIAASAVVALGLSGCFGNPVEQIVGGIVEGQIENATGIDVDAGSGASVPADFPGELPQPSGSVISSMKIDGSWQVYWSIPDVAEAQRITQWFHDNGWTAEAESDMGEMKIAIFTNDRYRASITTIDSGSDGVQLAYMVSTL